MDARFSASYHAEVGNWQIIAQLSAWDDLAAAGGNSDIDRVSSSKADCEVAASRMDEAVTARSEPLSVGGSLPVELC